MTNISTLKNKNFYLKELVTSDVSDDYLSWVNDPEITRFLEIKHQAFNKSDLIEFIIDCYKSTNKNLWGIYCNKTSKHIGNISITCDTDLGVFDGGYFIGDREYWGTSAAFEALTLMMKYGFDYCHMRRIIASAYSNNMSARFLFHKIGFERGARIKESHICDNLPIDTVIYSMSFDKWTEVNKHLEL